MRRVLVQSIATALLLIGISTSGAFAKGSTSGAHFFSATPAINDAGTLVVSWDEAGLGQAQTNYTLTALGTAVYACINGGSNHPQASNKETVSAPIVATGTFTPTNGRVKASLAGGPVSPGSFSCPSGQTLVLASASYSSCVLTDTTNTVVANMGDIARIFIVLTK